VHLGAVFGYSAARERGINSRLLIAWLVLALAISCARFLRFALDEPDWLAAQVSIKGVAHSTHAHSALAVAAEVSRENATRSEAPRAARVISCLGATIAKR